MSENRTDDTTLTDTHVAETPEADDQKNGKGRTGVEIAAQVAEATGWNVAAQGEMSLVATKPGLAPITVHCSSAQEAAEIMLRNLLDENFQPLAATKNRTAAEESADGAS